MEIETPESPENPEDTRPLRAGELARCTGVSKDTLRFYERAGLLPRPARTANGYRLYPPEHPAHAADTARPAAAAAARDRRGHAAMGFAHEPTTPHFRLAADGGSIEVPADDPADTESRDQIRAHLADIARRFAAGDFASPFAVHARVLPGVPEMTRLAAAIHYSYEELERGGRVVIRTDDPAAREAVHAFLRAQIADHQTGDPG